MSDIATASIERNYGLDFARILAMVLVVLYHLSGLGVGDLSGMPVEKVALFRFFMVLGLPCVNVFALLSGFLCIQGNWKIRRILSMWCQVVVTGFSTALVAYFVLGLPSSISSIWKALLPIVTGQYWYFNAYMGLFFMMPVLNAGVKAIDRRTAVVILTIFFLMFSCTTVIPSHEALFTLNRGYSVIWIVMMYLTGAILKTHSFWNGLSPLWCFTGAFLLSLVTWSQVIGVDSVPFITKLFRNTPTLNEYTSPTTVMVSVLILLGCSKLRIRSIPLRRLLLFFSPMSFGVYLMHVQPIVWNTWKKGGFGFLKELPIPLIILSMVVLPPLLFVCLALVDFVRLGMTRFVIRYLSHVRSREVVAR